MNIIFNSIILIMIEPYYQIWICSNFWFFWLFIIYNILLYYFFEYSSNIWSSIQITYKIRILSVLCLSLNGEGLFSWRNMFASKLKTKTINLNSEDIMYLFQQCSPAVRPLSTIRIVTGAFDRGRPWKRWRRQIFNTCWGQISPL